MREAILEAEQKQRMRELQRVESENQRRKEQLDRALRGQQDIQRRLEKARAEKQALEEQRLKDSLLKAEAEQRRKDAQYEAMQQEDELRAAADKRQSEALSADIHSRAQQQHQAIKDQLAQAKKAESDRRSQNEERAVQIQNEKRRIQDEIARADQRIETAAGESTKIQNGLQKFKSEVAEESKLSRRLSASDVFEKARREREQKLAQFDHQREQRRHTHGAAEHKRLEATSHRPLDNIAEMEAKIQAEKEAKLRKVCVIRDNDVGCVQLLFGCGSAMHVH